MNAKAIAGAAVGLGLCAWGGWAVLNRPNGGTTERNPQNGPAAVADDRKDRKHSQSRIALEDETKDGTAKREIAGAGNDQKLSEARAIEILTEDFGRVAEVLASLKSKESREMVLSAVILAAYKKDPEKTVNACMGILSAEKGLALFWCVQSALTQGSLKDAKDIQLRMPFSDFRNQAILTLAPLVIKGPPDALFAWLDQLQPTGERSKVIPSASASFYRSGDEASLNRLLDYTNGESGRQSVLKVLGKSLKERRGVDSLEEFGRTLPPGESDFLYVGALDQNKQPAEFLLDCAGIKNEYVRGNAISKYFFDAAKQDPANWATKALAVDDSNFKSAVSGVIQAWQGIDTESLSEWVQKIPDGARKDVASAQFALGIKSMDKGAAQQALSWISNKDLRAKVAREVK